MPGDTFLQLGWLIAWTFVFGLSGVPLVLAARAIMRRLRRGRSSAALICFATVAFGPVFLAWNLVNPDWHQLEVERSETAELEPGRQPAHQLASAVAATSDGVPRQTAPLPSISRNTPAPPPPASANKSAFEPLIGTLPVAWMLGASLTSVTLFFGVAGTLRLRLRTRDVTEQMQVAIDRQFERLGGARMRVVISDLVSTPILLGVVRPAILLPATAVGWSAETLEFVLLHEIAHARRWDNLVNLIQRVIEVLLFFQPAVWLASAWVREEREFACDRFVTEMTGQPTKYARALVSLATDQPANAPVDLVTCSSTRHALVARVAYLLGREETMKIRTRTTVCGVAAFCLATIAGYQAFAADETEVPPSPKSTTVMENPPAQAQDQPASDPAKEVSDNQAAPKPASKLVRLEFQAKSALLDRIRISSTQSGLLRTLPQLGQEVEKGAVVATLHSQQQALAVESLKEQLNEPIDLQVAQKQLALAERKLDAAKSRSTALAKSELEVLVGEVDLATLEVRREHSKIRQLRSKLQLAELALKATDMRSPIAGRITKVSHRVGERVNAGDVVVEITSRKRLEIQFRVPSALISRLRRGMAIEFTPRETKELPTVQGTITSLSDEVSVVQQDIVATAIVDNPEERLRGDQIGRVSVLVPTESPGRRVTSVTVNQRRQKPILKGARLSIGDITAGQVLVTVADRAGRKLISRQSMKLGDVSEFEFEGTQYRLRISQLTNVLIGTDFAVFEIDAIEGSKN